MLTGRYHLRTGTTWVTHGLEVMRSEERTFAESLSEQGYSTACYGKWHNGEHYPHNPNGQGFDTFFGFSAGHWNNYFDPRMEYNGWEVTVEGYIIDVLIDREIQAAPMMVNVPTIIVEN
ncbi:MAG: sulfatase-like hydrolase/transferase [Bacteroidales bacterium]|nr:sulfatase-like hydrolase/transferase [Bacteroidales bacterium]